MRACGKNLHNFSFCMDTSGARSSGRARSFSLCLGPTPHPPPIAARGGRSTLRIFHYKQIYRHSGSRYCFSLCVLRIASTGKLVRTNEGGGVGGGRRGVRIFQSGASGGGGGGSWRADARGHLPGFSYRRGSSAVELGTGSLRLLPPSNSSPPPPRP